MYFRFVLCKATTFDYIVSVKWIICNELENLGQSIVIPNMKWAYKTDDT